MMTLPPTYQHTGERSDVRIVGANFDRAAEPFSKFLRDPVNPVWIRRLSNKQWPITDAGRFGLTMNV